jgi:hypothetical protein
MTITTSTVTQIASSLGLNEAELFRQALASFLREKKRQLLEYRLELLARYHANSPDDLEAKIVQGDVAEHPAWEDLIVIENLTTRVEELNAYLVSLQNTEDDRIN